MAKFRYDIDYIKYGFSYIEDKRGNNLSALFDFKLNFSHLSVKGNFSSLPSHSFVCFCLSLNLNFVSLNLNLESPVNLTCMFLDGGRKL